MLPVVLRSPRVARTVHATTLAAVFAGSLAVAGSLPASAAIAEVRPIGAAERRAVELAARYLAEGPTAWWPELATDSPLRELGEAAAVDEIAVRAGPPEDARWVLQTPAPGSPDGFAVFSIAYPSGVEETLTLWLVPAQAGWRIREIRGLADLSRVESYSWDEGAAAPPPGPAGRGRPPLLFALVVLAGALAGWLAFAPPARSRATGRGLAGTVACGLAAALVVLSCGPRDGSASGADAGGADGEPLGVFRSLGDLRELRWALAAGAAVPTVEKLASAVPAGDDVEQLVALWRAELDLSRVDLGRAEALLDSLPEPAPIPLGDLLRARLAFARGEAERMEALYEHVGRSGTDHDGLRFETAQALFGLGRTIDAGVWLQRAAEMGSRMAEVHYGMAAKAVLDRDPEGGEAFLARAWSLEPVPREVLLGEPLLAALCARPTLFPTFSFGTPEEPLVSSEATGRSAVALPPGAVADLAGELLRVEVGEAELFVPAGAALAPEETTLETAVERRERREERVLARLPTLLEEAGNRGVVARPRRLRETTEAATALARHHRWEEIVELTDGISGSVEVVPPVLGQLRAVALRQTGSPGAAQTLLVRLAKTSLDSRRKDPGALRQLAELLVETKDYELAIRLMKRAESLSPLAASEARVRQVRMEQELYGDAGHHETAHFEVVYPRSTGPIYADDLGLVLEAELGRISRWIPAGRGEPHTVHVYPLFQFLDAYSGGMLVLGLYDGRLNVPFADLKSLHPELVAILSHELAHAMLARATGDQAPKWLHEGLAQHVEMVPGRINPIPDLHREGRILSFPMIEAILAGFAEPQLVDLAYAEAAWVVHYLEAEHGVRSIRRLIAAYAAGKTTEEAIREVFGMTVAQFDAAVWEWCLDEAPASWPTQLRRYDQKAGQLLRRAATEPGSELRVSPAAMRSWHAVYAARTHQAKRLLSTLVEPLRRGWIPHRRTCRELEAEARAALADPRALAPPLPEAREPLALAFRGLRELGARCEAGDVEGSRRALRSAESALARAAKELDTYGLTP